MKINIRFKGGSGSGNFGHTGRPGKQGGSAPGGGKAIPTFWPRNELKIEDNNARKALENAGRMTYVLAAGKLQQTFSEGEDDTKLSYANLHPKAMHNFKLSMVKGFGIDYDAIPAKIAEYYGRGINTWHETRQALIDAGLNPSRKRP